MYLLSGSLSGPHPENKQRNVPRFRMSENAIQQPKPKSRIVFIDVIRAYAILMMVQGHFTDTLLGWEYRDEGNFFFFLWNFMRGMTAPTFFFSSGLIFTYLLMADGRSFLENRRLKKGLKRVGFLLMTGYLIRFNLSIFFNLADFRFENFKAMFAVDVLHCIGIALFCIIVVYSLHKLLRLPYLFVGLPAAFLSFLLYQDVLGTSWSHLPIPLASYFTLMYGSNFTPIPWVGFALFGSCLGYLITRKNDMIYSGWFPVTLILSGLLLNIYSSDILVWLYDRTGWDNLQYLFNNNFLFFRLGQVLIVIAVMSQIAKYWTSMPKLIPKIGSETLLIYVVHGFIIYGSIFNLGLSQTFRGSLTPAETFFGAVLIELFFIYLVFKVDRIRKWLNRRYPQIFRSI